MASDSMLVLESLFYCWAWLVWWWRCTLGLCVCLAGAPPSRFTPVCSEHFRWFESSLLWRTFWFFWKSPYSEIVLRVSRLGILYIDEKLWYSGTHVLVLATVWVIMSSPKQVLDTCLPPVLRFYLRADLIEILWLKSLIPEGSCPSWEGGGYGKQLVQTGLAGFPIQSASNYACTVK